MQYWNIFVPCYSSLLFQLLGGVKGHMLELLKSVFTAQSPDDSVLPDVMATIFATVLAELSFFSSHVSIASKSVYVPPSLSYDREHFSNTGLYALRIVGTCDILVYQVRHQIMWFARLVDSNLLSICVITCYWNCFFELAMCEMC